MSIRNFSRIAASNAAVDNINFSENQAANTLNDSARELMADIAEWRDDNEGDLLTTGATNAYVLATRQTVPSLVTGVQLAFRASFANTGAATLNVDSLGAKSIRKFASLNSNVTQTGTYSRTGSTVTVTITSHGYVTGQSVILTFTTGAATNGTYVVTVTNANTFTVTDAASGTTSGNVSSVGPFLLAPSESALSANDIVLNGHYTVRYDTAANSGSGAWVLLNPSIQIGPLASKSALATSDYADNSLLPSKLSTGAPVWDTSGNVTASNLIKINSAGSNGFRVRVTDASSSNTRFGFFNVANEADIPVAGLAGNIDANGSTNFTFGVQSAGSRTDRRTYTNGVNSGGFFGDGSQLTGISKLSTATGSAPSFSARAWVNFDMTTLTIRGNRNVSSLTYYGPGACRVNFTTAMPSADYCVIISAGRNVSDPAALSAWDRSSNKDANGFEINTTFSTGSNNGYANYESINAVVFA